MTGNLFTLLESRFPEDRTQTFIERPDGSTISYGSLLEDTGRLANLLASLGVSRGDRVVAMVEKSPEAIALYLACLRAGAIYLPLNTAYQSSEIAYFLNDSDPKVVVCRPADQTEIEGLGAAKVLTLAEDGSGRLSEASAGFSPHFETLEMAQDELAALLYTSGTTGRSKGAMLSHGNLASNALSLHRIWGFHPDDILLHALPIFHTHGLFVATNCVLLNGSAMIFLARFDAAEVCRLLPRCSVMMGVPTFYTRLLSHDGFSAATCQNMRLFISGSAPLLEDTFTAFEARSGQRILERYGMTETGMNSSNPLDGERRAGTVGFPLPDVEVRIADDAGSVLPQGEVGVLEVRGPNIFKGYWRNPEKTAEEFTADGFFITGDIARIDERGYIQIVGRAKDLIISGGFNVYPKEIELMVDDLPGVKESAVIGLAHPDFGEAVAAVVVTDEPQDEAAPEEATIIEVAKQALANYKVPKRVFFLDELPRNAMGKVQKNKLRDRYKATFDVPPGTATNPMEKAK